MSVFWGGKKGRKRIFVFLAIALFALAGVVVAAMSFGGARITGDSPQQRIASIYRLADEKPRGAGAVLARAAVEEPDAAVRRTAMLALGRFVDPQYRWAAEHAAGDDSSAVRTAAAATMGLYKDSRAAERLGEMASDPDREVRMAALAGLGQCPGDQAVVLLLRSAESSRDPQVRLQAAKSLLGRFHIGFTREMDPEDTRRWRGMIERIKRFDGVQRAHANLSAQLVRHPEDVTWRHKDGPGN